MMVDLISYIIDNIVDEAIDIDIKSVVENGNEEITILVPDEHMGKVIGKNGRIAKAMRLIANSKASKDSKKVYINIVAKEN